MNELELRNTDIIKVLKHSLPDLDTIRIEAGKDGLRIFGVDRANVLYLELIINKNAFYRYEITSNQGITISLERFRRLLEIASSGSLTDFHSLSLSFMDDCIDVSVKGKHSKFDEKLFNIPTGITESPPLPDFDNVPLCELNAIKDFRLGSTIFSSKAQDTPSTIVLIEISDTKKYVRLIPSDPTVQSVFVLYGNAHGSGKTATQTYVLDNASKVADLEAVKKLVISLIDGGNIKFSYSFDNGQLNYIVAGVVPSEY